MTNIAKTEAMRDAPNENAAAMPYTKAVCDACRENVATTIESENNRASGWSLESLSRTRGNMATAHRSNSSDKLGTGACGAAPVASLIVVSLASREFDVDVRFFQRRLKLLDCLLKFLENVEEVFVGFLDIGVRNPRRDSLFEESPVYGVLGNDF